jgi:hypothetical protein
MAMLHSVGDMMPPMEPPDPEKERQRLLARYSGMPDQQLELLAKEWESLTVPARLALKQEVERRGMHVEFEEKNKDDNCADAKEEVASANIIYSGDFITIREIDFPGEALVAKGLLESAGIKTLLVDALNLPLNLDSMPLPYAVPIRLQVSKEDAEMAIEILGTTLADDPESGEQSD